MIHWWAGFLLFVAGAAVGMMIMALMLMGGGDE